MSSPIKWAVGVLLAIFVVMPVGMRMLPGAAMAALQANAPGAEGLTCHFPINHVCPGNANRLDEQARIRGRQTEQTTPTTTPATQPPRPYDGCPPGGCAPAPPPVVGVKPNITGPAGAIEGGGGIIGELPVIGRALTEGLKALPPGAP